MNELFTKNDLKIGMAAVTREGENLLFYINELGSFFANKENIPFPLASYDDDLISFSSKKRDIMKIYKGSIVQGLDNIVNHGELIFSRREIDWGKVPVDTKIRFTLDGKAYVNRYFAKYQNGQVFAFKNGGTSWSKTGCIYPLESNNVKLFEDNPNYYKEEEKISPLVEEFREIEGFSNYKISNFGKIFSKERTQGKHPSPEKEIKSYTDKRRENNVPLVTLISDDKKRTCRSVAWFVAKAFLPNPENKRFALLIDRTKPVAVDNIFWANNNMEEYLQ